MKLTLAFEQSLAYDLAAAKEIGIIGNIYQY